jgi:hypothetical protein
MAGSFSGYTKSGFFADGGGTWEVNEPNGDNFGTGEYTLVGTTLTVTNLTVSQQPDPNFEPCIGIAGQYTVAFANACDQFSLTLISDTCLVREADAAGAPAMRLDGGS